MSDSQECNGMPLFLLHSLPFLQSNLCTESLVHLRRLWLDLNDKNIPVTGIHSSRGLHFSKDAKFLNPGKMKNLFSTAPQDYLKHSI